LVKVNVLCFEEEKEALNKHDVVEEVKVKGKDD
jgi:hypothetical protein